MRSLRVRFALLLGGTALIALLAATGVLWSIRLTENVIERTLAAQHRLELLAELSGRLAQYGFAAIDSVGNPDAPPEALSVTRDRVDQALNHVDDAIGSGMATSANLEDRIQYVARTRPLANVRAARAMLDRQVTLVRRETDPEQLKNSLKHIGQASIRATHTVNQLLALARAETAGRALARQTVDLVKIASNSMADSVPRALEKRIDLGYDGPAAGEKATSLQGNPTLLGELVRNLLDNAINYTPAHGQVTLRLLVDPFSGILVLIVEDSGPGIPESERELVFQPFYRALGTNVDGSGLGLAIVLEIAQQHGASITIEDADLPGHPESPGTRVTLRFVGMA